jgi:LPS biosynthesis related glycosyltransferase
MKIFNEFRYFIQWFIKEYRMYRNPIDIKFYNHWSTFFTENLPHKQWFYRFIKNRKITTPLTFFSIDGYRCFIDFFRGKKVFFTGEYLHQDCFDKRWQKYADHCVDQVNLSLGFDDISHENYLRFPLWIMYFVHPEMTFEQLERKITIINDPYYRLNSNRNRFACQISHHDKNGIRRKLINLCNKIDNVTCAGNFMNTTTELHSQYNDNKQKYLNNFKFNICPENVSARGYVTEKILDAFVGGCIPIYWGGGEKEWIEPDIFNPEAFLYYEEGKEEELLMQIKELWEDKEKYLKFIQHPPFTQNAAKIIWEKITELEHRLKNL